MRIKLMLVAALAAALGVPVMAHEGKHHPNAKKTEQQNPELKAGKHHDAKAKKMKKGKKIKMEEPKPTK